MDDGVRSLSRAGWDFASALPSHAPGDYLCPFCGLRDGDTSDPGNLCEPGDEIYRDSEVLVFVASHGFHAHTSHPMVVPLEHVESLYGLSERQLAAIGRAQRIAALALKRALGCEGVTTRQNNEPHGSQHVWHYHLHVAPRWEGDSYGYGKRPMFAPAERAQLAQKLRAAVLELSEEHR